MNQLQWKAEKAAAQLLMKAYNTIQFPVEVDDLIEHLNITVKFDDLIDESGYIMKYKGRFLILVNNSEKFTFCHNKFTTVHEIAHVYLNHFTPNLSYEEKESAANHFAGAILMPFNFMVAYRSLDKKMLQDYLQVSEKALNTRIKILEHDFFYIKACKEDLYKKNIYRDYKYCCY